MYFNKYLMESGTRKKWSEEVIDGIKNDKIAKIGTIGDKLTLALENGDVYQLQVIMKK